ncbi:MAG: indole-3-glycerol phosphate synthase TrpC [Desulfobulbaceae bacterium]|nr:indole-3-glycerol phosphate synthase TrpC [Desulfobulbaceae bacterium]MCK5323624.1 indole-3-glycerol phosphate synthase TrpC [Desulfobulbaceae bacterium]MCK5545627.1 indole-3-glycerol phosphate synthase TrpC [Desulfobulbaceae bacterium]
MILDKIIEYKKDEVKTLLARGYLKPDAPVDPPRGFQKSVAQNSKGVSIIAEAKKASPSKGLICPDFDPVRIARNYKEGGAQAISVLTDENFFQGALEYIPMIRQTVDLPVLRKDFIIHEIQIEQARAYGADAILLIAAILDPVQIKDYLAAADGLGMDVLVEVHVEQEVEIALKAGSRLIGINNRDLKDFTVDLGTTLRLKKEIPSEIPVVSESGIRTNDDIMRLADYGVAAVLVGESLMRETDQAQALRKLMGW